MRCGFLSMMIRKELTVPGADARTAASGPTGDPPDDASWIRNLPLIDVMTMEEQIAKGLQRERMFATLCNGFGILAPFFRS